MSAAYRRILAAYDGSVGAWNALTTAATLAAGSGAHLVVVAVEAHLPRYAATVGEMDEEREVEARTCRDWLAEAETLAAARGVPVTTQIRAGHPATEIVRAAAEHRADLIVIGHSGHSAVWGRFLGGVAEKVSRHAPCSVLIVRAWQPAPVAEPAS